MQIKLTHPSDTKVTMSIVADQETLTKIKETLVKRLGKNVKVAGFRDGKAPVEIVEKNIDPQVLQSEFIDQVLNHYYVQAVTKENLRVVGQPEVNLKKFVPFTTFEFDVSVEVIGDIKLPDYKKVKVDKAKAKVTAADVTEVVESLQKRASEKKPVERAAKEGDEVIIDFSGTDSKGVAVNGADGKDYPLSLGSNTFIPGFETNIIGMKKGEEKSFTIPFPKDYGVKALQGKKVTFAVTIKDVQELALPKLDDAFAATVGPFKTLAQLKEDVKKQLELEKQRELDRNHENELLRAIAAKATVSIPDSVIDQQVLRMEEDEKQNLVYRGQTWQEHLDVEGVTEDEHRKRNRKDAEEQIKVGIVLGAIGDAENVEVTPEEVEIRMQLLKGQYTDKTMQAELDKPEARQDIAARLRSEKIIALLTK